MDLEGRSIPTPVIYPGSIERTSFAEKDETKGFFLLEIDTDDAYRPRWVFQELYARPMTSIEICPSDFAEISLQAFIESAIKRLPKDSIVKLSFTGEIPSSELEHLRAASLRRLAPPSMNISVRFPGGSRPKNAPKQTEKP
jgi:DNA repair exonuclease SbcCD nuclease subunit